MESIMRLYALYSDAAKANPVVAGLFGVWALGVCTYLLRTFPAKIWRFLSLQLSTGVSFSNAGAIWETRLTYVAFSEWYGTTGWARQSRRLSLETTNSQPRAVGPVESFPRVVLGPGYGLHYFIMDRWLFWFVKKQLESSGSETIKEQIDLFCLGRDKARLERVIERFKPRPPPVTGMAVYRYQQNCGWDRAAVLAKRPIESVFVAGDTIRRIRAQIEGFIDRRDWYLANGLPHKLTILLHGLPGCGKTSLVKALAGHYGFDIYTININAMSDKTFDGAIAGVPPKAFMLIEDFDSASAVRARPTKAVEDMTEDDAMADAFSSFSPLTLTGVLNALDGIVPLDNAVVFLTTNHIELIDHAILRKGRMDMVVELGLLGSAEISAFIERAYGVAPAESYPPMRGCDLQALVLEHKTDYAGFMQSLRLFGRPQVRQFRDAPLLHSPH